MWKKCHIQGCGTEWATHGFYDGDAFRLKHLLFDHQKLPRHNARYYRELRETRRQERTPLLQAAAS